MKNQLIINDIFFILPEIFLLFSLIFILLFGAYYTEISREILINSIKAVSLVMYFFYAYATYALPDYNFCILNYHFLSNGFLIAFKLAFLFLAIIFVNFASYALFKERLYYTEFFFVFGLMIISGIFLTFSNDLILFYFSLELQALCLYTLVALNRFSNFSSEAALKYFVLGAISSGFLLLGISLFYGSLGSTGFFDYRILFENELTQDAYSLSSVALLFCILGILFKLAAAPFNI